MPRVSLSLVLALCFAISTPGEGAGVASESPLRVGIKEAPPLILRDQVGEWRGPAVMLWERIAEIHQLEFEYQEYDLEGLLAAVEAAEVDVAVGALSMTRKREERLDFSHPYFLSGLAIILIRWHQGIGLGDPYMTKILTGALMGTLMWFNVWFIIWPAQKIVIANAETVAGGGEANPAAAAAGGKAGMASRTNTLFSIPMLLFMGAASHLPSITGTGGVMVYWVVALLVILAVEVNGLIGPGAATCGTHGAQKVLRRARRRRQARTPDR